jgi:hypothetical protein
MCKCDLSARRQFSASVLSAAILAGLVFSLSLVSLTGCSSDQIETSPTAPVQTGVLSKSVSEGPNAIVATASKTKETYFICPSVSTHNPNGMWVIGTHGGYYVTIPTKGGANAGSRVYLTIPVQVANIAQIPAGWALYKDLPSYPYFVGMAGLLSEGISTWLGSPAGWQEGDGAMVMDNGDGTYTVTNARLMETITITQPIPLASTAIW